MTRVTGAPSARSGGATIVEQQVLDHVDGEQLVRVDVDRRHQRDEDRRDAREPGAGSPARDLAGRMRCIHAPREEEVAGPRHDRTEPWHRIRHHGDEDAGQRRGCLGPTVGEDGGGSQCRDRG